jgi:hypothetical protein
MFPNFPNLAEAIAAERAADFQRDAAQYHRARSVKRSRVKRSSLRRSHLEQSPLQHSPVQQSPVPSAHYASPSRSPQPVGRAHADTAGCEPCGTSRAA